MYSCIPRSPSLSLTFHSWTLHARRPRRRPRRGSRRFPCHINISVSQNHILVFSLATWQKQGRSWLLFFQQCQQQMSNTAILWYPVPLPPTPKLWPWMTAVKSFGEITTPPLLLPPPTAAWLLSAFRCDIQSNNNKVFLVYVPTHDWVGRDTLYAVLPREPIQITSTRPWATLCSSWWPPY